MLLKRLAYKSKLLAYQGEQLTYDYNRIFFHYLDLYGATYDGNVWNANEGQLPFQLHTGLTLLPYAFSSNSVYARDNVTGLPINCTFQRAGAGWSMLNGDISQIPATFARIDDFYYWDELGYLIEGSGTTNDMYTNFRPQSGQGVTYNLPSGSAWSQAVRIVENSANAVHVAQMGLDFSIKTLGRRFRFFYEAFGRNFRVHNSVGTPKIDINTANNTVLSSSELSDIQIKKFNGNIYEVSFVYIGAVERPFNQVVLLNGTSGSYLGDGSSGIKIGWLHSYAAAYPKAYIYANGSLVTRPSESLLVPTSNTLTDVWLKTDQGEQLIEDFNNTDFPVHNYITNGKLLALMMPLRNFTDVEKSKFSL